MMTTFLTTYGLCGLAYWSAYWCLFRHTLIGQDTWAGWILGGLLTLALCLTAWPICILADMMELRRLNDRETYDPEA